MLDLVPALVGPLDLAGGAAGWAASGVMALTGRPGGPPLLGPASAAPVMAALADRLLTLSSALGVPVSVDGPALLGERAAIAGHGRQGTVSCGGSCRLLATADGWIAISLARDDDVALVPAWLEAPVDGADGLAVERAVRARQAVELVEQGALLGLPCAALGAVSDRSVAAHRLGEGSPAPSLADVTVVDLSSLWAGPLCTQLLAAAGATVIKVESTQRPDGARLGPRSFFDLLHAGQQFVALDFRSTDGRAALRDLLDRADVVVEASRPRALEQLGVDAWSTPAKVWLSITGYGRNEPMRVAFGDDAAVAGGLVAYDDEGPVFAADAAADPATGLLGAVAVLDRLAAGGRWLIDLGLARVAALLASAPAPAEPWHGPVAPPRSRLVSC